MCKFSSQQTTHCRKSYISLHGKFNFETLYQNHPVNSQFVGLSFTSIKSLFYINNPAQTADLSFM